MSSQDDPTGEGTGAARAARLATLPRALALGETRLIGTMGVPGLRRALVREAGGAVRTVERGDMVEGGRIVEVEADALRLHTGDLVARLDLSGTGEAMASSPRPRARPDVGSGDAPSEAHLRPRPRPGPHGPLG
ncbi:MAG: hypothetical protein V2I65_09460 [Paracoccaceae bacterium]|jgi:hypothetical protein|nr:hypothetical protein [Paracoccaceae bacterium]